MQVLCDLLVNPAAELHADIDNERNNHNRNKKVLKYDHAMKPFIYLHHYW